MDISKRLSCASLLIALIFVLVSFVFIPSISGKTHSDDHTKTMEEVEKDIATQKKLDEKKDELLQNLDFTDRCYSYTEFCNGVEDISDNVKQKKAELQWFIQNIADNARVCSEEVMKKYNSDLPAVNKLNILEGFDNEQCKKSLDEAVNNAEATKTEIETEVQAYKAAEEQRKKEEAQKKSQASSNSTNKSSSGKSSNSSSSSKSTHSSGSSNRSSSYSSGGSGYSSGSSKSSSNYSSSSGGSSSSSGGSSSGDSWGGSER